MVGDYCFDFDCGCVVGSCMVLVNLLENFWLELVDWYVVDCYVLFE